MQNADTQSRYDARLRRRLRAGASRLPDGFLSKQARYLARVRNEDGGFGGRRGGSDLYYLSFALRTADLLGECLPDHFWRSAHRYLGNAPARLEGPPDVLAWLTALRLAGEHVSCCWPGFDEVERTRALETLASCRADAGTFARQPGEPCSLYHTFLGFQCLQMLGEPLPPAGQALPLVLERATNDGGFADVGPAGDHGGVNPTAAAVGACAMLGCLQALEADPIVDFLVDAQRPDGGFAAHSAAPASDLMSTFTALVTLAQLAATGCVSRSGVARYCRGLAERGGGFRGAPGRDEADPEYTFYGLGALSLLAGQVPDGGRCRCSPGCNCCC